MTLSASITIRPVRTEADYETTLDEIARLMDAAPGSPDEVRLDVLATLVEAYEATHYPMDPPDPIQAIRFRMEQQSLTPRDLEPFLGSRGRVSEVLNGRRPLSLAMIRALEAGLGIPAAVLIRSPAAPAAAPTSTRAARSVPGPGAKVGRAAVRDGEARPIRKSTRKSTTAGARDGVARKSAARS